MADGKIYNIAELNKQFEKEFKESGLVCKKCKTSFNGVKATIHYFDCNCQMGAAWDCPGCGMKYAAPFKLPLFGKKPREKE